MIHQLSKEWSDWLSENIARDCTDSSLHEAMVRGNFDPVFAQESIAQARRQRLQRDYIYQSPRLPIAANIIRTHDRDVKVTMRVSQPVIAAFANLLTQEECDELVSLSKLKLHRSTIVDPVSGQLQVISDRSSFGTYFAVNENKLIETLDRRISEVMHLPVENGEGIQILHYKVGGEYKPHFDYFPPEDAGSKAHLGKGGQRVSTLIIYLNDVDVGGETVFPKLNLSVVPKKGSAVYFEYCNNLGQVDPMSLHGGNPVLIGEKWIATKWMRQGRYG